MRGEGTDRSYGAVGLQPEVEEFVMLCGGEFFDCAGDDFAYARHFNGWWTQALIEDESFIVIEHDVLPTFEAVQSLIDCPQMWCGVTYPIWERPAVFLGCTKFSAQMVRALPGLPQLLVDETKPWGIAAPLQRWKALDGVLMLALQDQGFRIHAHDEHPARHLRTYR